MKSQITGPAGPEIRPFDVVGDDCSECGDDINFCGHQVASKLNVNQLVIRTVNGPMRIALGYSVYAVKMVIVQDEDKPGEQDAVVEQVEMGMLIAGPGLRGGKAAMIAQAESLHPDRFPFDVTDVIVNDGTGETFERYPVFRIAA